MAVWRWGFKRRHPRSAARWPALGRVARGSAEVHRAPQFRFVGGFPRPVWAGHRLRPIVSQGPSNPGGRPASAARTHCQSVG